MARYTVQMTFETPQVRVPVDSTHRLPGRATSMRFLGGGGLLAVTASRVQADSPAEATMLVTDAVRAHWPKSRGPLTMASWTAHRERVLLGSHRSSSWTATRPDDGGSAGVREPRRPLPGPGSLHAEQDLPGPA